MAETIERRRRAITSDSVRIDCPAYKIIDRFGGLMAFCEICDFKPSTVQGWLVQGLVPAKWRDGHSYARWIITRGAAHGIKIVPADFIEG